MAKPIRIVLMMEDGRPDGRWSAGSPDLLDFEFYADTLAEVKEGLPAALQEYCGGAVMHEIMQFS